MAVTVFHVNIRSWKTNNYLLRCTLSQYNPDIILLNEINITDNRVPKISGYKSSYKCSGNHSGVAIFIKNHLISYFIEFETDQILAANIKTSLGNIIISTIYSPPRYQSLPTTILNKLLNTNLPMLIIGDFNSTHPSFDNTNSTNRASVKGKQLYSLAQSRNLSYLGPSFKTYHSGNNKGKPDLIFCNQAFHIFQHLTSQGNSVGSDHIPIIFKLQTKPFKYH